MFAEELGGSAARKRQEQARERRRQLKQKKEQKEKAAAAATRTSGGAGAPGGAALASSSSAPAAPTAPVFPAPQPPSGIESAALSGMATSVSTATPLGVASSSSQPSAAARALEQRKARARQKLLITSATLIQSAYRSRRSNATLRSAEEGVYDKRVADLSTLRALLAKAGKGDYAPPPATSSVMSAQALFLASRTPWRKKGRSDEGGSSGGGGNGNDEFNTATVGERRGGLPPSAVAEREFLLNSDSPMRLASLIEHALVPGLISVDRELDPILPWLQRKEGVFRLRKLLRLCMAVLVAPHTTVSENCVAQVDKFLRVVLGLGGKNSKVARFPIIQFCRSAMIFEKASGGDVALDLVGTARTLLLYDTGGREPIPPDATKLREGCVPTKDRERSGKVFALAFDAVMVAGLPSHRALRSRFVVELFTVPLLTWKVSPLATSRLIAAQEDGSSPPLVKILRAFVGQNATSLSTGRIISLLPSKDVPLIICPAPSALCLLANLVQLGHICTPINGSEISKLNFEDASLYFNLISNLIDVVPLGAFSSRRSAVEWVTVDGSHHTPIVLSDAVIDQCKAFVLDSYVRQLFSCAIDDEALGTEQVLEAKNEKDIKHEKDMTEAGAASAASLAAKEAMVDRSKGFWQSSKWARKLSHSVTSFLSKDSTKVPTKVSMSVPKGGGKLLNTSSISRHLATKGSSHKRNATAAAHDCQKGDPVKSAQKSINLTQAYSTSLFFALCRAYGAILSRWGGGGKDDIVGRAMATVSTGKQKTEDRSSGATAKADPCVVSLLNVICFATNIVKASWAIVQSDRQVVADLYAVIDSEKRAAPVRSLRIRPVYDASAMDISEGDSGATGAIVLFIFVTCLAHTLIITDDIEIHEMARPLPQHQLRRCILLLKKLLYRACCVDDVKPYTDASVAVTMESNHFGLALISGASKTMRDLYDRSSRRPLCVPKLWLVEDLLEHDIRRCKSHQDYSLLLSAPVLRVCPFLVSFKRRLKIFERLVSTDRINIQGSNADHTLKPGVVVRIMRGRVLEDGLIHLNNLGRNLRQRIVVQYISQAGATETGVDVGGLFKEFWADLSNLAFDPNYALFRATEGSGNSLYPNPSSRAAHGSDHVILFEFLGRILGKALYEGITIQPQFAHFFLSFLRGDYNFLHMLPDLSTMDPQLYNNLMFLKTYDGDTADLCLTFTVANDDFGGNREVPLIPNGADVEVTNSNKQRYIGLMAKYHVCDRVREQSEAFTRGLWEVIDRSWLQLFNEPELQVLISGASDGKIDVSDMKSNTRYTGGYTGLDKNIYRFWNVVSSFNSKQQADLLRFVTSCERPPPLGFAIMNPPFTIQRVGIMRDGDKLPTASTCFNTLKLPTYSSEKILRERLLFAIQAGAGFELT